LVLGCIIITMVSLLWNLNPAKILMSDAAQILDDANSIVGSYNLEQMDFSKQGADPMNYSFKAEHISVVAEIPEPLKEEPEQEQIEEATTEETESGTPLQMRTPAVDLALINDSFEDDQTAGPTAGTAEPIAEPNMTTTEDPEPVEDTFEPDRNIVTNPREVTATLDVAGAHKKPLDLSSGYGPLDISHLRPEVVEPVSPSRPQHAPIGTKITYV